MHKFYFLLITIIKKKYLKNCSLPAAKETEAKPGNVTCSSLQSNVPLSQEGQKSASIIVCLKISQSSSEVLY